VLDVETALWAGFLITGVLILLLGAIAALVARRFVKKGTPPKPQMAIEEAQLIKGTLTGGSTGTAVARPEPTAVEGRR
jgi:membrane protein implicated in regulation of membrane protease activity